MAEKAIASGKQATEKVLDDIERAVGSIAA
jgi:hypothetical protein